jgi:hypothetical protein
MTPVFETIALLILITAVWMLSWIALKNWKGRTFLCDDCRFNNPDLCHKQERPYAMICTAYRIARAETEAEPKN